MGKLWLAFAFLILVVGEAAAQDLPSMDAHLECWSGEKPLKNGKKQAIAGDIRCLIGIDAGVVPDASTGAMMQISQAGMTTSSRWGTVVQDDGKVSIAFDGPFARLVDFLPCKDLTIEGAVGLYGSDISQSMWHGKFTVKAKCKKPKKMKAKLACIYQGEDGTVWKYPGNGAKTKPRLETGILVCSVTGKKKVKGPEGILTLTGSTSSIWAEMSVLEDMKPYGEAGLSPSQHFETCMSFTVKAVVTNALGQTVYSGKQKISQDCPD